MSDRRCPCGATYDGEDEDEVIGLPERESIRKIARSIGVDPDVAEKFVMAIPRADKEEAEGLIAYQARQLIRVLKRAKRRSDAKAAAISRGRTGT